MSIAFPGRDEIIVTCADGTRLGNSPGCARARGVAQVVATFGTLNDPAAGCHYRGALRRESRHQPVPMRTARCESSRQVAVKYRPGPVVIDVTGPAVSQTSGGRA